MFRTRFRRFSVMEKSKLRIWEISLMLALCLVLCLGTWAQARQSSLSDGLVRLHVLAVSDDDTEQQIKLKVRDGVLEYISPLLESVDDPETAQRLIASELDGIKAAAQKVSEGRPVTVTLTDEYYPTRSYGTFSLPAGKYKSLRVILGEGKGHNWWCVVFPPLCISAAESDAAVSALSDDDRALVTEKGGTRYKFRIIELWGEVCSFVDSLY